MKFVKNLLLVSLLFSPVSNAKLATELLAKGFDRPVWVGAPDSVKGKLWVMEQAGTVWIVDLKTGERAKEPFLKINKMVTRKNNEQGLLGLAFAPDFEKSGIYYVSYNQKNGDTRIVRFRAKDGVTTDAESGEIILEYKQPFGNHNGGWLDFGPDGYLYIGTGDGGAGDDPNNNAQNKSSLLGKLLRLDVSGKKGYTIPAGNPFLKEKDAKPEVVANGLRNPWRCSFDRKTGDFWIGDVGQNKWEEIDAIKKDDVIGKNFGWRLREGDVANPNGKIAGGKPKDNVEPVYVYLHGSGPKEGLSVTGGYVYRGSKVKELQGRYIFADYQNPRVWSFVLKGKKAADFQDHTSDLQPEGGRINLIPSFGEDADGEIYLVDHSGPIYRIVGK